MNCRRLTSTPKLCLALDQFRVHCRASGFDVRQRLTEEASNYVVFMDIRDHPGAGSMTEDMEPLQRWISGSGPKAWI